MDMCTRYFYARILTIVWCVYAPVAMVTVTAVLRSDAHAHARLPRCYARSRGDCALCTGVPPVRGGAGAAGCDLCCVAHSRRLVSSVSCCVQRVCARARIAMVLDRL